MEFKGIKTIDHLLRKASGFYSNRGVMRLKDTVMYMSSPSVDEDEIVFKIKNIQVSHDPHYMETNSSEWDAYYEIVGPDGQDADRISFKSTVYGIPQIEFNSNLDELEEKLIEDAQVEDEAGFLRREEERQEEGI